MKPAAHHGAPGDRLGEKGKTAIFGYCGVEKLGRIENIVKPSRPQAFPTWRASRRPRPNPHSLHREAPAEVADRYGLSESTLAAASEPGAGTPRRPGFHLFCAVISSYNLARQTEIGPLPGETWEPRWSTKKIAA